MTNFRISSDDFENNGVCGKDQELNEPDFGTNGKNLSPRLHWEGVPPEG